jgi:hypothetical protein
MLCKTGCAGDVYVLTMGQIMQVGKNSEAEILFKTGLKMHSLKFFNHPFGR